MNTNPHGGDIKSIAEKLGLRECPKINLDFSVNINPLGAPPILRNIILKKRNLIEHYPQINAADAAAALADSHNIAVKRVLAGNGSTELFALVLQAIKPESVGLIAPCYAGYKEVCNALNIPTKWRHTLTSENNFTLTEKDLSKITDKLIFIGSPNNPTGIAIPPEILLKIADNNPACTLVVDESFIDFCSNAKDLTLMRDNIPHNIIVIKSLTKFFAIPGLRLGMLYASEKTTADIAACRLPWSVNAFAQEAAIHLFQDEIYIKKTRQQVEKLRNRMRNRLSSINGITVFKSDTNFILIKLHDNWTASALQKKLISHGILIRNCDNYHGLNSQYCRLAVRPDNESDELIQIMDSILSGKNIVVKNNKPSTPAIMVVGTTSDSGKSIVATGLCRLMARRNLRVSPFKAQNMALNSYVTEEGGEMGRAQVTQAAAAGIRPHTDMNPILLKPLGEDGSQVIVNGKPIGNFKAKEYYTMKNDMRHKAHKAYDRLAAKNDIMILEGAGSPAEINLLDEDFVNMDMAAYANAGTILVADIDRGGVFATILGTIELIPERYRNLIAGIIINKFRGDISLLESGIRDIETLTGIPVIGVLPYLENLRIEEEDSMGLIRQRDTGNAIINVAVIRLPRISNYTDFQAMENDMGINVRYIEHPKELGNAHLIIIPGTKNTRADLEWLHNSGMSNVLIACKNKQIPIIGICGGYQMLGEYVIDTHGIEGKAGKTRGMGLLNINTFLSSEKELAQVQGITNNGIAFIQQGIKFRGYEIHAGKSAETSPHKKPLTIKKRGEKTTNEQAGAVSNNGMIFGCYVHGFFDNNEIRKNLWHWLCQYNNLDFSGITVNTDVQSSEFDRLANVIEERVDLTTLFDDNFAST